MKINIRKAVNIHKTSDLNNIHLYIPGDILVVMQFRYSCRSLSTSVSMLPDSFPISSTPSATSLSNDAWDIFFLFRPEKCQIMSKNIYYT